VWLRVHLCIALAVGFLFSLIGLTGSINVFYVELDEWLNQDLLTTIPSGPPQPLNKIVQAIQAAHPARKDSWHIHMPRHERGMMTAWYYKPKETEHMFFGPLMVSVDPYSAEVVANRFWGDSIATWIYELHADLWMGKLGLQLVGISGIILLISLATGLYLWWPSSTRIKLAFTVKLGASTHRTLFDMHRVCGIYSFVVLFTLAGTGIYLVYKDYVASIVGLFSAVKEKPFDDKQLKSNESPGGSPISLDRAVAIADRVFPKATLQSVTTPNDANGVYRVDKRQPGEANALNVASRVWIDQYSGRVLAVRDPTHYSAGETFLNVLWPLHNGEAFGFPGRVLVCLTGLVPTALYATGFTLWWHKRSARSRRRAIEGVFNA
jgi:uncharacterized iron-regulated membrane protein